MASTKYNSTKDMIDNIQQLRENTKLELFKNLGNYFDNMKFRMDEDPFAKNAQGFSKYYHEVFL